MSLIAPMGLLLAAVVAIVVLLHMRQRRTVHVPSLAIWRRLQTGQQRRSPRLGWPRLSWPFALQVLAILLAALALAQPVLHRTTPIDHWIFIVDHSSAMSAVGENGELLDDATRRLTARLAEAGSGERVSIIAIGEEAVPLVARRQAGKPGLADAIGSIAPQDGRAAWDLAPATVRALMQPGETSAVVVFSDEAVAITGLPDATISEAIVLPPLSRANASLTAQLVADPAQPFHYMLEGSVLLEGGLGGTEVIVSYSADGVGSSLEWTRQTVGRPDAQLEDRSVQRPFSIPLELPGPGVISVSIAADANPSGNHVWFVTEAAPRPINVLYVGDGQQPLLTAIGAIDGTEIYEAEGLPADSARFDLVIVDNRRIARAPEGNVLWIGDAGVEGADVVEGPSLVPTAAMSEHPLMRGVDWADIDVQQSFTASPAAGAPLLSASDIPLILAGQNAKGRAVRLQFDPRNSDWAKQSSLPVFATNLMSWLGLRAGGAVADGCVVGERCVLDARYAGGTIERLDVPGGQLPLLATEFRPTSAGLYRVAAEDRSQLLAVNAHATERAATPPVESQPAPFPLALWPWLLAATLLVLVVEAVVAGRGSERFLHLSALARANALSLRRRTALVLRIATLSLLLLAIFNVPLLLPSLSEAVVAVVAPGAAPTAGPAVLAGPQTAVSDTAAIPQRAGDDALALRLAAASLPFAEPGRILFNGEGSLGTSAAQSLASELNARNITVSSGPAANPTGTDVAATGIEIPGPLYAGDSFQLTGIVHSAAATNATVAIARDGVVLVEQQVALVAGDNRIDTLIPEVAAGSADYELRVTAAGDAIAANNSFHRVVEALPLGKVAVIAGDETQAAAFVGWLSTQGLSAEHVLPIRAPYKLKDWRAFDGAVLLDVPAIALTTQQQEELRSAVADEGLGLLMLGGPNAFGPGGYLETPLDDLSPLSSRVPRDMPEATLVFVLDRSGSMQQPVGNETRLDVAKQATLAAVKLLNAESQVGIIVFDAEATTVLPLQKLDNVEAVAAAMSTVDPGGGTSIYPGLQAALDMLRGLDSPARHIIVMTDGLSQPADFPGLLAQIRQEGITVSSVSIGKGAERELVAQIALLGDGTFHATDDFSALPSILSQEAMLLSGAPIEEYRLQPLWASRTEPFLRGLPDTMPPIDGFVLTTPKPEATLSIAVPDSKGEAMPLLASWRYGNGSVLALATDAAGPWSAEWQQLPVYPALWSQALRQFLPSVDRRDLRLSLSAHGDGVRASVAVTGDIAALAPTLVAIVAGREIAVPLNRAGSGRYEATYYPDNQGAIGFDVRAGDATASATYFANYPAHLRPAPRDDGLAALVAATARTDAGDPRWLPRSVWQAWALAAAALLLAELAVRYTSILRPTQPAPQASHPSSPRRRQTRVQPTSVAA